MNILANLKIRWKLSILVAAAVVAVCAFALVSFSTLRTVEVNGPLYKDIAINNNLVADTVPPAINLMPTRLLVYRAMFENDRDRREQLFGEMHQARKDFEETYHKDLSQMPAGKLKSMLETSVIMSSAQQYFTIIEQSMIPALRQGDNKRALEIRNQLATVGEENSRAIDELVKLAGEEQKAQEEEANATVKSRTWWMIAVSAGSLILKPLAKLPGSNISVSGRVKKEKLWVQRLLMIAITGGATPIRIR